MVILDKILMEILMIVTTTFLSVLLIWFIILILKQIKKLLCEE